MDISKEYTPSVMPSTRSATYRSGNVEMMLRGGRAKRDTVTMRKIEIEACQVDQALFHPL